MNEYKIFINRRDSDDRRVDNDPCRNLPVDIYHRKRRKAIERRNSKRTLADDYLAFFGKAEYKSTH